MGINVKFEKGQKRFGIECFVDLNPPDRVAHGDASEYYQDLGAARLRIDKLLNGGRFKYIVLYDGMSNEWSWVDDFILTPKQRVSKKIVYGKKAQQLGRLASRAKKSKASIARRRYTKDDVKQLKSLCKAKTPIKKIARAMGRTELALAQKARLLNLRTW